MLNKVIKTVEDYNMLEDGDNIIVGLSGGVDSMALLHLLLELKSIYDIDLHIAHLNHGVRGSDAKRDQIFVEKVAEDLKLPYYTQDVDMDAYAKENKITSEEAGRFLRYQFFNEIIDRLGDGKIAVGHNLNDQAETLIMRFLRGTGIDGLRGIEYTSDNVIRPILGITRGELEEYIDSKGIEITEDMTNFQPIYTRNKIRLEIIPYIIENFNPNIIRTLERTSQLADIDMEFLEKYTKDRYNDVVLKETERSVVFKLEEFNKEHPSIKQRLIRLGIERILGNLQGISYAQVNTIIDLFKSEETGKQVDIIDDLIGRINYDELIIEREGENDLGSFDIVLEDTSELLNPGYRFNLNLIENKKFHQIQKKNRARYFDYDKIKGRLRVRNRVDGDTFNPFGMKGSKKIKDYFIDEKIPRDEREKIPLIVDHENILWVVGYRTSELYRIDKDTTRILEISYEII